MSLNFGQFPVATTPIQPTDKVVGYQLLGPGLIPTLAQYSFTQLAGAISNISLSPAVLGPAILVWFNTLPTVLPATPGVLWNNGGTLAQS